MVGFPFTHKVSSMSELGHEQIYKYCMSFKDSMKKTNQWESRRSMQNMYWFEESVNTYLKGLLKKDPHVLFIIDKMKKQVGEHQITPTEAAKKIIETLLTSLLRNKDLDGLL